MHVCSSKSVFVSVKCALCSGKSRTVATTANNEERMDFLSAGSAGVVEVVAGFHRARECSGSRL